MRILLLLLVSSSSFGQLTGICLDDVMLKRWRSESQLIKSLLEARGEQVEIINAEGSVDKQCDCLREMSNKGAKNIIVIAAHADSISMAVRYAQSKGSKVIAYDRMINDCTPNVYVSFDNKKVGEAQMRRVVQELSKAQVVIINGPSSDVNTRLFAQGHQDIIDSAGGVQILRSTHLNEWNSTMAQLFVVSYLSNENLRPTAVVAVNDQIAKGVIDAYNKKGIALPLVTGQDGTVEALHRIKAGTQNMTVLKDGQELAKLVVAIAMNDDLAEHRQVNHGNSHRSQVSNNKGMVAAVLLDPVVVTAANVDRVKAVK